MSFKKAVGVKDLIWKKNGERYQPNSFLKALLNTNAVKSLFVIREFDQSQQIFKVVLSWDSYDNTSPFGVAYFRNPANGSIEHLSGPGQIPIAITPNKIGSVKREDVSSGYNQSVTLILTSAPYTTVEIGFARAGKFSYAAPITLYKNNSVLASDQQVDAAVATYYYQLDLLTGTITSLK